MTPASAVPAASPHIPEIDGLRALAIVGVVYHHYSWDAVGPLSPASPFAALWLPLRLLLESGWLGVNLFFFLSAVVLYLPYARGERRMDGMAAARAFVGHRLRRLMPLYYLAGIIALAFGVREPFNPESARHWTDLVTFLTVTFNFRPDTFVPAYNWVLWSLGLEIWFSLLFPLLLPLYTRHRAAVLAVAVLVTLGLRWSVAAPFNGLVLNWIGDSLPARLPDFLFGMLAVDLALARSRLLNPATFLLLGVGGVFAGAALWHFWFLGVVPVEASALPTLLLDVGFLFGAGFLLARRTALNVPLGLWPVRILGAMCYSVYMWHAVLEYRLILVRSLDFAFRLQMLPVYLGFLLVLSALSYRFIEFGHRSAADVFLLRSRRDRAGPSLKPPAKASKVAAERAVLD